MKRLSLSAACALILGTALLSAQTFDVSLDGSASLSRIADFSSAYTQSATFAVAVPIGLEHRFAVKLGASVGLTSTAGQTTFSYPAALGDIDLQEFGYTYNGPVAKESLTNFAFNFGRFPFADTTGAIYAYRLDGAMVQAVYSAFQLRAVTGFTGFLSGSAPIIENGSDILYGNKSFAPPRILAGFSFKTTIVPQHEIYVALLAQEDIRNVTQLIPEWETAMDTTGMSGSADAAYLDAGFTGSLGGALSYFGYGIFQFGRSLAYLEDDESETGFVYKFIPVRAFSTNVGARYILNANMTLSGRVLFGTGDANGPDVSTAYAPLTRMSTGMVFSPQPNNISFLEAVATYKPFPKSIIGLNSVQATSKTVLFAKNGVGSISEAGVMPDAGFSLLGIEEDISAVIRLTSDFNVNVMFGVFCPLSSPLGAFDPSFTASSPLMYMVRAGFSLTL